MAGFIARFFGVGSAPAGGEDLGDRLAALMPYHGLLSPEEQTALAGIARQFYTGKYFEGCRGFAINDSVRLCVAAHAALLQLNLDAGLYPGLKTILVYPESFIAQREIYDETGMVTEFEDELVGESWDLGTVIFSWREVLEDTQALGPRNVLLHEFAHQLDPQDEASAGWPAHFSTEDAGHFCTVVEESFHRFSRAVSRGSRTVIEEYGAEDPAEFFAVVTEMFFLRPRRLHQQYPRLYDAFRQFYRQDPITRFGPD